MSRPFHLIKGIRSSQCKLDRFDHSKAKHDEVRKD
jgi:hypothetical protein